MIKIISRLALFSLVIVLVCNIASQSNAAPGQRPKKAVPKEQPKTGGTLVVGLGLEFSNPHPFIKTTSIGQFVKESSYEPLLASDENNRIVPNLAESYEISAGGTVYTLRLRKGVKFHNGKEMKADDVVWSANHVKEPKNGATGQNLMNDVKSIEKLDDYTVRFTLPRPSITFRTYLASVRMLPIIPANSLQPGQIKLEANSFVPGTGAFIFDQYQPGFDTVLKKFPDYWGGAAYLDKLIFRPIVDDPNRFNALRSGDVQMAERLAPLDAARIKKGQIKGLAILEEPDGFRALYVNNGNPLLQKLEMRQALADAIDKKRLADEVYFESATPTDLIMDPKGVWAKAANLPQHKRNLAKAKALLKAAGYNGQELVTIGRKQDAQLYESLQRMLGEAGIKVKVEIAEAGVRNERIIAGKYDLYVGGGSATPDPVITMVHEYYTNPSQKGSYSNLKVDKLSDNLDSEFDEKKRLKIFKDLVWTLYNDAAGIPLFFEIRYFGMSDKVHNYGPAAGQSYVKSGNYFKRVWLN